MAKFRPSDVLRLEIEEDDAGLANLVQNPSGALGGWGWVTPVDGSTLTGPHHASTAAGFEPDSFMRFTPPGGVAAWLYTEPLPVEPDSYAAARWEAGTPSGATHTAAFEWLDVNRVLLGASFPSNQLSTGEHSYGPDQAPAGTAFTRLRFDVSAPGGGAPSSSDLLEITGVTVATAAAAADLGSSRTNIFPNPSFEDSPLDWKATSGADVDRDTTGAADGTACLTITSTGTRSRANLMLNPSFEESLGGWRYGGIGGDGIDGDIDRFPGLVPPFIGTWTARIRAFGGPSKISASRTAYAAVTPGARYAFAARFRVPPEEPNIECRVAIRWYDGNGREISTNGSPHIMATRSQWRVTIGYAIAPSRAAQGRMYVQGFNVRAGDRLAFDGVQLEQTDGELGPYFDGDTPDTPTVTYSWVGDAGNSRSTRVEKVAALDQAATSAPLDVVAGQDYTISLSARGDQPRQAWLAVTTATGTSLITSQPLTGYGTGWRRYATSLTIPDDVSRIRVSVRYDRIDPLERHYVDAVMVEQTTELRPFIVGLVSDADLSFIEPIEYVNVLGPTHQIQTSRAALDVGTLTATLYASELDPTVSDVLRPGRRVRLRTRTPELGYGESDFGEGPYGGQASAWQQIFTGRLTKATVTYDPLQRDPDRRARLEITATDPVAPLANVAREEGVATIGEAPFVLEGAGVPWNVNGSGGQVPTAVPVARNDQASALDQVAITRDTALGYAWVDREGVLQAWDSAELAARGAVSAGGVTRLDEGDYRGQGGIDLSYDTDLVINEITVNFLRLNPATGETEEVTYGPWRDEASVRQWGVRSATYTVQGLAEETSALEAYASAILTANANPRVRASAMVVPIHQRRQTPKALIDLYDLTTVVNGDFVDHLYVTSVAHDITPTKWLMTLGFADTTQVAPAQVVPSPTTGSGALTIGQLLRPLGEVTMLYGDAADVPPGWLVLDGSTFSEETYPRLAAHLGSTVLPNLVDRFPIGAGSKALGTTGGNPTKAVTQSKAQNTATGGSATRVTDVDSPIDVMPPWLSIYFIIRAV